MKGDWRRAGRSLLYWDAIGSLLFGGLFFILVATSDAPLEDSSSLVIAAMSLGGTIAFGSLVAGRWITDRIKDDAYGEVVRKIDYNESRAQLPFFMVAWAGLLLIVVAIFTLLTEGEFGRAATTVCYSVLVALVSYNVLGLLDLVALSRRHLRRQATLRALKEEEERRRQDGS
ncbi:hypothetical protein AB0F43_06195 [Kribbella sp. NPDC023972]|uniref:hypothetical protein n=1 Tax=Kribbella sp. NPDC023972 TaxID=3154795 RepID=UPI003401ECDE